MRFRIKRCTLVLSLFMSLLCSSPALSAADAPLVQSIYHNAFLAAIQKDYVKVMQHWYLFYSLDRVQNVPQIDAGFGSLLWASVNALDLCPENLQLDSAGDQVWSLVLHNYIVRHRQDRSPFNGKTDEGLESLRKGYQKRSVPYYAILDVNEIKNIKPEHFTCSAIVQSKTILPPLEKENANQQRMRLMQKFLQKARQKWNMGDSAKLLDIRIYALEIALNEADKDPVRHRSFVDNVGQALEARLDDETRQFLPQLIADSELDSNRKTDLLLRWLDQAISQKDSQQILRVISLIDEVNPAARSMIWSGDRGQVLLELGKADVFSESPTIAFYRAIDAFRRGQAPEALRLLALSLKLKGESPEVNSLATKWIKYILLQFRFESRYIQFLREYLPKPLFKAMAADLVWTSVFYREEFLLSSPLTQDLFSYKLKSIKDLLLLIAKGRDTELIQRLKDDLKKNPRSALGFIAQVAEQLSGQSNDLIQKFLPILRKMNALVEGIDPKLRMSKNQASLHAALDALLLQGKVLTPKQEDRQLGGESSISLGTVAMEPSDALIWPFPKAIRIRLSVFKELKLDAIYDKSASAQGEYSWTIGER